MSFVIVFPHSNFYGKFKQSTSHGLYTERY